jgi:cytochrome c peroxidase
LELDDSKLDARAPQPPAEDRPAFIVDVAKDGDGPKIEPKYAGSITSYLVHLFSDLKRHDMGDGLASPAPQGTIPARMFLTRPLWGLAETAPYLHDGRAPTVQDAIVLHGGEASAARDAYLALDENARASVRVFLASLSRQPKLFVP